MMHGKLCMVWSGAFALLFFSVGAPIGAAQSSKFVAPGATVQTIKKGYSGTEGPAVDADGNVYFTTVTMSPGRKKGTIQKWNCSDGTVSIYRDVDGGAIGSTFDAKGRLLLGEWDNSRITVDDMNGNVSVLADAVDGRKMLVPNTVWADYKGGIYFSEWAGFKIRMGGGSGMPGAVKLPVDDAKSGGAPGASAGPGGPGVTGSGGMVIEAATDERSGIDYISPDGKITQVAKLSGAHKVALSPDGKTLYASGESNQLWKYQVAADGKLSGKEKFCQEQCSDLSTVDGIAFDESGNLYLMGSKIYIYSPQGKRLEAIDFPEHGSNLKFAGFIRCRWRSRVRPRRWMRHREGHRSIPTGRDGMLLKYFICMNVVPRPRPCGTCSALAERDFFHRRKV
jgi:gluconolactonase